MAAKKPLAGTMKPRKTASKDQLKESSKGKTPAKKKASTREGTKVISGHFPEPVYKQFKVCATLNGQSLQDALATALNLYFEEQNQPAIAPINKPVES